MACNMQSDNTTAHMSIFYNISLFYDLSTKSRHFELHRIHRHNKDNKESFNYYLNHISTTNPHPTNTHANYIIHSGFAKTLFDKMLKNLTCGKKFPHFQSFECVLLNGNQLEKPTCLTKVIMIRKLSKGKSMFKKSKTNVHLAIFVFLKKLQ